MKKILLLFSLVIALASLGACCYFFFVTRQLVYGSLSMISACVFILIYAMSSSVNQLPEGYSDDE
ncbi:MAG: hypothetical protein GY754_17675 [bacterium]|nr:hypothetical protein [bacterium]